MAMSVAAFPLISSVRLKTETLDGISMAANDTTKKAGDHSPAFWGTAAWGSLLLLARVRGRRRGGRSGRTKVGVVERHLGGRLHLVEAGLKLLLARFLFEVRLDLVERG